MTDPEQIQESVLTRLTAVIDPETNVDVVTMGLIPQLDVDADGLVRYTFRPSSPICPIAVFLALNIIHAIFEVEGVSSQEITVTDYMQADALNQLLKEEIARLVLSRT